MRLPHDETIVPCRVESSLRASCNDHRTGCVFGDHLVHGTLAVSLEKWGAGVYQSLSPLHGRGVILSWPWVRTERHCLDRGGDAATGSVG